MTQTFIGNVQVPSQGLLVRLFSMDNLEKKCNNPLAQRDSNVRI